MRVGDLTTPALVVDTSAMEHNLSTMSVALPAERLRPHVKAHKCTSLARAQSDHGHHLFTCATIRECEGMAAAGLGTDLLLANEVLDASRLGALVAAGHRVTLAVDSDATIESAVGGGVPEVLIDVNVGLPRCGCPPDHAGALADLARQRGLDVRGVMGYEGHAVGLESAERRTEECAQSMQLLLTAHADVGGDLVSAGGTGTYAVNRWANEIQAGSYALMDTAYGKLGLPFQQAVFVLARVISANPAGGYAVADCGLKALGMDHGNPSIAGASVWFCSDEHVTFAPSHTVDGAGSTDGASAARPHAVGSRVLVQPAHIDPTLALHDRMHLVDELIAADEADSTADAAIVDTWEIDLRGW